MPRVRVHPLFLLLIVIIVLVGESILFLNAIIAVIIHELGHARVAKNKGYVLHTMTLMPYGAVISGNQRIARDDAVAIYVAGPCINAIIALIFIALWWLIPNLYIFTKHFAYANLVLATFNMLPLYPLDGSKILINVVNNRLKALVVVKAIGIVVSLLLFALFIVSTFIEINISLGVIAIFLFAGAVSGCSKDKYNHISSNRPFVKHLKDGMRKDCVLIPFSMPLYKILKFIKPDIINTFSIVNDDMSIIRSIDENDLRWVFENNDITTSIGKALNL